MSGPRRRLRVLAVDDEPPALDELGYLLDDDPRVEVRWVEARGDYARLHTAETSHLIRVPLSVLADRWADAGFVRIHRSYLVSLRDVRELRLTGSGYVVLTGDRELPVSRRHT